MNSKDIIKHAQGWLELGDYKSASEELDKLPPAEKAKREVLWLRFRIYGMAGKWSYAEAIARGLFEVNPNNSIAALFVAQSLHKQGRNLEAFEFLKLLLKTEFSSIPYHAAKYACQAGLFNESKQCLDQAINACMERENFDIRELALDDPLLEPLWKEIGKF